MKCKNNVRSVEVQIAVGSHVKGAIKPDRYLEYHLRGMASGLLWLVRRGQRGLDGAMRLKFLLGTERG